MCIVHGLGEHSGRFRHVAENFVNLKYDVLLIDMRGFGYSGGARGCPLMEDLQRDVTTVLKHANPNLPLFIYGHSLGGLIVLALCFEYPHINFSGIMLTSPLLGFPHDKEIPWIKLTFVKLFGHKLEEFVVNSMVNPTALTKSNKHIQTILGDRLMIPFLSMNMARSILTNIEKIHENAHLINIPILIVHGKQDSVTSYHDSVHIIEKIGSKTKLLHLFENGYHEMQHDEECDEMLRIGTKWFGELPTSQLGVINLQKRKSLRRQKLPWGWIVLVILYLLAIIKLSRKMQPMGLKQHLLAPFLYLLNRSQ